METANAGRIAEEQRSPRAWGLALGHGLSQIFFQANIWTGLLILVAFIVADWRMAVLVVLGSLSGSAAGRLLARPMSDVQAGMQGFCGALVGAATFAALGGAGVAYPIAIVGGALTAPVTWLIVWLFSTPVLKPFNLPYTTSPFCIVATGVFVSTIPLHVSSTSSTETFTPAGAFVTSLLLNVSQVVLVDNIWAGALILLGLFIASWKVGLAGIIGSAIGSLTALAMGDNLETIAHGLSGYSSVLTAIALAAVFLAAGPTAWLLAVIGAVLTSALTLLMHLTPGPIYTWPYILTTWVILVVAYFIPPVKRA